MEHNINKDRGVFLGIITGIAGALGVWSLIAFVSGLASVDFYVAEMGQHYLSATGTLYQYHSMVDFYSRIKGLEYLIVGAFFLVCPALFIYLGSKEKIGV